MTDLEDVIRELRQSAARLMDTADELARAADRLAGELPRLTPADVQQAAAAAQVGPLPLTSREEQLVQLVREHGAVSPGFAAQALNVERSTISRVAREPIERDEIEARGATKSRRYCIPGWTGVAAARTVAQVVPVDPDAPPDDDLLRRVTLILRDGPCDERALAERLDMPQLVVRQRVAALVADLVVRVDRVGRYELLASDSRRSDRAA